MVTRHPSKLVSRVQVPFPAPTRRNYIYGGVVTDGKAAETSCADLLNQRMPIAPSLNFPVNNKKRR